MANSYTQLYVHYVFTVQGRENLIKERFREELEKVICGIIANHRSKTYAIYCNPDHIHVFVGMTPSIAVAKLIEQIKSGSTNWLNKKGYVSNHFKWQDGYGAFSYAKSQIDDVVKYILNQPEHHKRKTFKEEYLALLNKFEIEYNSNYLFEWYDK